MTTGAELIALTLKDAGVLGVGQAAQAEDVTDTQDRLNDMLGQWNSRRWLVFHEIDTGINCSSAISYTVGPGGNFNIERPDQIKAAYMRQLNTVGPNQVDYPMTQIFSREDYSQITLKNLSAPPSTAFFYDAGYPQGSIFPWPVPTSGYALHIVTQAVLTEITDLAAPIALPRMYREAIRTNLVVRTRSAYQMPSDPVVNALAKAALQTIRSANVSVSRLNMPGALQTGGRYNIYSDSSTGTGR